MNIERHQLRSTEARAGNRLRAVLLVACLWAGLWAGLGLIGLSPVGVPAAQAEPQRWGLADVRQSHHVTTRPSDMPEHPLHDADPLGLFVVIESGGRHVTVLDGNRFEPIGRIETAMDLQGAPRMSPDGRTVFFGARDGWVAKLDLHSLQVVARVRAGRALAGIAVSADGKWVMAGNRRPHSLVVLHAGDLAPFRVVPVTGRGGSTSAVAAIRDAPARRSFVVALEDLNEVWELSYDPEAPPILGNFVHTYRKGQEEGIVVAEQPFGVRRIAVESAFGDFVFDPYQAEMIGASRAAPGGQVVNLDARRKVADLGLSGEPRFGSAVVWMRRGRPVMAVRHRTAPLVSVIDMESWQTVALLSTRGPGRFVAGHDKSPYLWVDVSAGPGRGMLQAIDKERLEVVKTWRPASGKAIAQVAFSADGGRAFVAVAGRDGALIVYDAATLDEIKRLPLAEPSGAYGAAK